MKSKSLLFVFLMCFGVTNIAQNIIHVPGDQPTIQAGIDAANTGDIVLVDQGTYYENINFKGKAITVASNYITTIDSADIYHTIIDGSQSLNPDSASVVFFGYNEDSTSIIQGFTIQGGTGTYVNNVIAGGGILSIGSEPTIINNRIIDNECRDVGGYAGGGGICLAFCYNTAPIIRDNYIANNACYKTQAGDGVAYGGGISIESGNYCYIENNTIDNNHCYNEVVGEYALGGGIYADHAIIMIKNNHILNNYTENVNTVSVWGPCIELYEIKGGSIISGNKFKSNYYKSHVTRGGALAIVNNLGDVSVERNTFESNNAGFGSALALEIGSDIFIRNNVFMGNIADLARGTIYVRDQTDSDQTSEGFAARLFHDSNSDNFMKDDGVVVAVNNTLVENTTTINVATSLYSESITSPIVLFNNIFKNIEGVEGSEIVMNNLNASAYLFNNVLDTANHVNCSGGWDGKDNINVDPAFWDDSCHLNCYIPSPCIDAGIEELEIEGTTYLAPGFDFEGEIRPMDQAHDMGADETMICVYIDENRPNNPEINIKLFPNPFESIVTIDYSLNRPCYISLRFYNLLGDEVANIEEGSHNSGTYSVNWNFEALPSGIYFYRFTAGDKVATGKVIKR